MEDTYRSEKTGISIMSNVSGYLLPGHLSNSQLKRNIQSLKIMVL